MNTDTLKGKVALVTGSSRGIGKAIARNLAGHGADMVITFRKAGGASEEQASALRDEITAMGREALVVQADISSRESVRQMAKAAAERFGRLDILVLNAARTPFKPLEKLFERELRQLVDTNYIGNIYCIQEALTLLRESRGSIVFISSLGSRFYNPAYPLGSMKAAMESVVRDCAEGLREYGVSVNAVCGGLVRTDSFKVLRHLWEEVEYMSEDLFVTPEEIADAVFFLCSPLARGIAGQTVVVDRGLSNRLFRPPAKK